MTDAREFTRAELQPYADTDTVVEHMLMKGVPLTRENYLQLAYGADMPKAADWNHEHEAGLPEPFRDPSSVIPD